MTTESKAVPPTDEEITREKDPVRKAILSAMQRILSGQPKHVRPGATSISALAAEGETGRHHLYIRHSDLRERFEYLRALAPKPTLRRSGTVAALDGGAPPEPGQVMASETHALPPTDEEITREEDPVRKAILSAMQRILSGHPKHVWPGATSISALAAESETGRHHLYQTHPDLRGRFEYLLVLAHQSTLGDGEALAEVDTSATAIDGGARPEPGQVVASETHALLPTDEEITREEDPVRKAILSTMQWILSGYPKHARPGATTISAVATESETGRHHLCRTHPDLRERFEYLLALAHQSTTGDSDTPAALDKSAAANDGVAKPELGQGMAIRPQPAPPTNSEITREKDPVRKAILSAMQRILSGYPKRVLPGATSISDLAAESETGRHHLYQSHPDLRERFEYLRDLADQPTQREADALAKLETAKTEIAQLKELQARTRSEATELHDCLENLLRDNVVLQEQSRSESIKADRLERKLLAAKGAETMGSVTTIRKRPDLRPS